VSVPRITLAPSYTISRVIKGGWQLAGGHGAVEAARAHEDMTRFVEAGITTFDCADIYTGCCAGTYQVCARSRSLGDARAA
jgi:aryl-alcohol dehydrogenase-like predicted oxidoreductase